MNLVTSFLLATSFAYLGCAVFSIFKRPALVGIQKSVQTLFYLFAFIVFQFVTYNQNITILNYSLGILYAFASVGSFIGYPQIWRAYWKSAPDTSSGSQAVGMAAWDLALGIVFFYLI